MSAFNLQPCFPADATNKAGNQSNDESLELNFLEELAVIPPAKADKTPKVSMAELTSRKSRSNQKSPIDKLNSFLRLEQRLRPEQATGQLARPNNLFDEADYHGAGEARASYIEAANINLSPSPTKTEDRSDREPSF